MSADDSQTCHNCEYLWTTDHLVRLRQAESDAAEAYGTAEPEVYDGLRRRVFEVEEEQFENQITLYSYEEFWIDEDGEFGVKYSASCRRCGFRFEFKTTEQIAFPQEGTTLSEDEE